MMHIAFLTPEYPHQKVAYAAGIGTSIGNLVAALRAQQIAVSVFVYGQKSDEVFTENGIKIHLLKHRKYAYLGWYKHRKFIAGYLNKAIAEDQIDLVEAPDWTGITAFMKLKAPLVIRFHGTDAYFCHLEHRKQKFKNFVLEKWGIRNAAGYIAPTDFAAKTTQYIFKLKKPVQTIHYGLSLSQFDNPSPEVFTPGLILYIGTIIRKKGVLELPAILEKVLVGCPFARLVMIGADSFDLRTQSASTWELIEKSTPEHVKKSIEYLGKVPYVQIREYIASANVCVFPTFAETLGMVTIESMAMQKAVVNSNIGWAHELIDDGVNGYLVHPADHAKYAQRISDLLQDPQLCIQIGRAARQKTQREFDIEKLATDNIAFYRSIINQKK